MRLNDLGLHHGTDKASTGHDYLQHYERFFAEYQDHAFTLVEIGGLSGASLGMWRDYFPQARIVCLDINPAVKRFEDARVSVEIGDAGSRQFLRTVREKYGAARVVIDDGSHRWDHQRTALKELFPMVEPGGYYVVEDIHTSYEPNFAGKDDIPFVQVLKTLVDYLHLRKEHRKAFEAIQNRSLLAVAQQLEFACFIPRSCILRKRS